MRITRLVEEKQTSVRNFKCYDAKQVLCGRDSEMNRWTCPEFLSCGRAIEMVIGIRHLNIFGSRFPCEMHGCTYCIIFKLLN